MCTKCVLFVHFSIENSPLITRFGTSGDASAARATGGFGEPFPTLCLRTRLSAFVAQETAFCGKLLVEHFDPEMVYSAHK